MMSDIDRLTRLLPPPGVVVAKPPWERSRDESGIIFPSDYRAFVDLYGAGEISAPESLVFKIYGPSSAPHKVRGWAGFAGYAEWHEEEIADMFSGWTADEWGGIRYLMFPEPGGLLTWGENQQGDMFWWLTEGDDPDKWPIVMWERAPATTVRFDCGMVELVYSMVNGDYPSPTWMHSPETHWTMTSDWLRRNLRVSAGPAT